MKSRKRLKLKLNKRLVHLGKFKGIKSESLQQSVMDQLDYYREKEELLHVNNYTPLYRQHEDYFYNLRQYAIL